MKILVTGAEGMLGRAMVARFGRGHLVEGVDLDQGDLGQAAVCRTLLDDARPDWVVNCAAWTAVDAAEERQDEAMTANAVVPGNLVAACDAIGCGLTHISTDYVFDGKGAGFAEDSPRAPLSHYGRTKARGEQAVEAMAGPWQIVRTSWLFGDGPVNFVKTIVRLLDQRPALKVVDDQTGCPTYTEDLASVVEFLVTSGSRGIFHATNAGSCTWYEFARAIAEGLGRDPRLISPCPSSEYPTAAVRPVCSVLLSRRLEEAGCPPRPSWQDALARYLTLLASGRARFP
ncbi:MAG: dTDP-4-dehydrorhamnose reductase [Candidatus Krumholzibacteriia bacterium]